ncbi:hypothetical protein [Mariniblastus fucicola]|uniref:Uncharacterized protein n=1 Tax=Mariniblastus fucicola TaxID=980251 RepID=A0A5B9PAE5_9BACT|nr:hypothetical protein [Mariniblastus fucicola]QEG23747.1 hypothetical protein MFFC18_36490 [Mariniblastus fucicola]
MSQTIDVADAVAPVKKSRSWQFSLRGLLILTTICCVATTMIAIPPLLIIAEVVVLLALAIFTTIASFYGRGWIRPFSILCIGTLLLLTLSFFNMNIRHPGEAAVFFLIQFFASVAVGLCGAATHGFLKQRFGVVPIPNIPFLKRFLFNPVVNE